MSNVSHARKEWDSDASLGQHYAVAKAAHCFYAVRILHQQWVLA
jgi:hypothetical protein